VSRGIERASVRISYGRCVGEAIESASGIQRQRYKPGMQMKSSWRSLVHATILTPKQCCRYTPIVRILHNAVSPPKLRSRNESEQYHRSGTLRSKDVAQLWHTGGCADGRWRSPRAVVPVWCDRISAHLVACEVAGLAASRTENASWLGL